MNSEKDSLAQRKLVMRQRELALALLREGPPPAGFDALRIEVAAQSLAHKKAKEKARRARRSGLGANGEL